ncbi:hypothetical protein BpHYR1_038269 [Brachionus plicatilis]|uniref:Uncharacterized protein n=1 Tax=Brachionus plicatilis TaxID=10195 RepID=A0A3M7RHR6_BRAPC|nr:hypothetical protein BpHYR1_038269 [Brachionus plicatilis]
MEQLFIEKTFDHFDDFVQHGYDHVCFINGDQRLASDGLDCPAGNTRTCHRAIERQLVRNCEARTNFFTNRTAGDWNALDAATRCASGCYSGASTCATTWRPKFPTAFILLLLLLLEF